jgi:hypothetical protein
MLDSVGSLAVAFTAISFKLAQVEKISKQISVVSWKVYKREI